MASEGDIIGIGVRFIIHRGAGGADHREGDGGDAEGDRAAAPGGQAAETAARCALGEAPASTRRRSGGPTWTTVKFQHPSSR
eukprot:9148742-Alexandrium_andersonii.AAC.1